MSKQWVEKLQSRFSAEAAGKLEAIYQFDLTDEGAYFLTIQNGNCEVTKGEHPTPNVSIKSDTVSLKKLMKKELNPMTAVLSGKVKIKGDLALAAKLSQLFSA